MDRANRTNRTIINIEKPLPYPENVDNTARNGHNTTSIFKGEEMDYKEALNVNLFGGIVIGIGFALIYWFGCLDATVGVLDMLPVALLGLLVGAVGATTVYLQRRKRTVIDVSIRFTESGNAASFHASVRGREDITSFSYGSQEAIAKLMIKNPKYFGVDEINFPK